MSRRTNERREAVFTDINRNGALPEEDPIQIAKMTTIKITWKEIHKNSKLR